MINTIQDIITRVRTVIPKTYTQIPQGTANPCARVDVSQDTVDVWDTWHDKYLFTISIWTNDIKSGLEYANSIKNALHRQNGYMVQNIKNFIDAEGDIQTQIRVIMFL